LEKGSGDIFLMSSGPALVKVDISKTVKGNFSQTG
jgi:hypothetical protein